MFLHPGKLHAAEQIVSIYSKAYCCIVCAQFCTCAPGYNTAMLPPMAPEFVCHSIDKCFAADAIPLGTALGSGFADYAAVQLVPGCC